MAYYLGIDIGATNLKGGIVSKSWKIKEKKSVRCKATNARDFSIELINFIKQFNLSKIERIGIGSPGPINIKTGKILKPVNLPFQNLALRDLVENKIGIKTHIDNDANCFALAESIIGKGKDKNIVVGLTLGTGIGGGIVIDKQIYHGRNNAGEFGHTYCNGKTYEIILHHSKLKKKLGFKAIDVAAKQGKPWAKKFWQGYGQVLGQGVVNLIHCFDPDILILGGKVAKAYPHFAPALKEQLRTKAIFTPPPVVKSQLIDSGSILGAALLCKYHAQW